MKVDFEHSFCSLVCNLLYKYDVNILMVMALIQSLSELKLEMVC